MRYRTFFFTAAFTILAVLSSHASFQEPATTPEKPLYKPSGSEATVVGTILVNGQVPKPKIIDMGADPVCVHLNKEAKTEALLTNNQRLRNAFVYLKEGDALKTYRFEVPQTEVVLEHRNCQYSPRVVGLQVGQPLSVVNTDATVHNTHPTPKNNAEFNQSQPPEGQPVVKTFTRPELFIPFKDNQHPWEKGYVGVLPHPFFAVSDELGNFEIRGVPAGTYKLVVWHELLGEQEVEITVAAGETRKTDLLLDVVKALERMKASAYPWD